jgi:hypothetical protein
MAQLLTVASLLAVVGWLGRRYAISARRHAAIHRRAVERRVYKASAQDFLRGAADLTFGMVIFGLGFFMLMWVIATA